MLTVKILKGCPGSGKSTYAKTLVAQGYKRVNNDLLRECIDCNEYNGISKQDRKDRKITVNEGIITWARKELIKKFLKEGFNVVVDNVNTTKFTTDEVMKIVESLNIDCVVEEVPLYVDLQEALDRDAARPPGKRVGTAVVTKFWGKLGRESFKNYEPRRKEFKHSPPIVQNPSLPKAFIVDLDGTVANNNWRNPYDASNCIDDPPIEDVVRVVRNLKKDYDIVFVSARDGMYREQTREWLIKYVTMEPILWMRTTKDTRPDEIVKREIFQEKISQMFNVVGVFDDRSKVVKMWRNLGLTCFAVAEGDF